MIKNSICLFLIDLNSCIELRLEEKRVKNSLFHTLRSEYDRGVNCFSPEGRIHQIEYAIHAMKVNYFF
jgi:hypothetical protein